MLVLYDTILNNNEKNNYVALGSFDGFHLGHLSLVKKIRELAENNGGKSIIFTFKNNPKSFLYKDTKIELINNIDEKIEVLEKEHIDILALKTFDSDFMQISAEEFVKNLCEDYGVKAIVVGFNYRFGYKNSGDVELLKKLKNKYNFKLYIMDPYIYNNEVISSTRIRHEIKEGNVKEALNMLSRPYKLIGKVVHGKEIGRTIEFPTANLQIGDDKVIPKKGVYYTNVEINNKIYKGITSIGNNPTVNGKELTIETHIINFDEFIYDRELSLYFIEKIRDEQKFKDLNHLKTQLKSDKEFAVNNKYVFEK